MFIEAKKLIGLPIASLDTESKIGEIKEIIVDPENGHILGFLVKTGGFFSPNFALSIIDITDWDPNGIVTGSEENLVDPNELVRFKKVLDKKIILIGMGAKTENGKRLGLVEDFLLDSTGQIVTKYYLKDLFGNSRVLPADKVVKIDKQIIFTDDVAEPRGGLGAAA